MTAGCRDPECRVQKHRGNWHLYSCTWPTLAMQRTHRRSTALPLPVVASSRSFGCKGNFFGYVTPTARSIWTMLRVFRGVTSNLDQTPRNCFSVFGPCSSAVFCAIARHLKPKRDITALQQAARVAVWSRLRAGGTHPDVAGSVGSAVIHCSLLLPESPSAAADQDTMSSRVDPVKS